MLQLQKMIKLNDAAEMIGVSAQTLRGEIKGGRLRAFRLKSGRRSPFFVTAESVAEWIKTIEVRPTADDKPKTNQN